MAQLSCGGCVECVQAAALASPNVGDQHNTGSQSLCQVSGAMLSALYLII